MVKRWIAIAAGLALLGFGISTGISMWQEYQTPPEEVVMAAMEKTMAASQYQYTSESIRVVDGKEELLSKLNGQKNQGNTHLAGSIPIVNSEIEVYQIGDTFYRQDIATQRWLVVSGYDEEATEVLIQEIDPLSNFYFQNECSAEYMGKEKINGVRCRKYQVYTAQEGSYLSALWEEYYYTLWIDKKGDLQQVEMIAADHENKAEQLKLTVQFDWLSPVEEITAPI